MIANHCKKKGSQCESDINLKLFCIGQQKRFNVCINFYIFKINRF